MGKPMTQYGLFLFDSTRPNPYKRLGLRFLDISIMGIFYLLGGILFSTIINQIFPVFDKQIYDNKSLGNIIMELSLYSAIIMCFTFILRQLISVIKVPFDGWWGYNHNRIIEIRGGVIVSFAVLVLLTNFDKKLKYIVNNRFNIKLKT